MGEPGSEADRISAEVSAVQAGPGMRVWVENTPYGDAEVMVLNPAIGNRPFCYCSFHYRAGYTDADSVHRAAERAAVELGAEVPVQFVARFEC